VLYLHRILPIFLLPVGVTLLLVLAGLLVRRRALIWTGIAVLWLSSTPVVSRLAVRATEGWAERGLAADASDADAIVVLSEGRVVAPGKAAVSEWNDADRFFGGLELFKAGKSPLLVFTGGAAPWEPNAALEGDILAGYAKELGVPEGQIAKTPRVTNTAEEAVAVATLLRGRLSGPTWRGGPPRILLVTSAFHMPRARRLFERAGMSVIPFPVDFQVLLGGTVSVLAFLPTASALQQTEMAMREWYGRLFYFVVR
jgi:uncharacterized SAM-binding protein YcdF (DUF218 family)